MRVLTSGSFRSLVLVGMLSAPILACDESSPPTDPLPPDDIEPTPAWNVLISHRALARPLVDDGSRLYVSAPAGITAVDPSSGAILWSSAAAPGLIGFAFVLAGQTILVNTESALFGLDAESGGVRWEEDIPSIVALAFGGTGSVYVTDGSNVLALEALTGAERWSAPIEDGGIVNLAASHDLVCAERLVSAPSDARVTCYDADDGSLAWSEFYPSASSIALTEGRVILAEAEINVQSGWIGLRSDAGDLEWELPELPENVTTSGNGNDVIFGCEDECVAVDPVNGGILWRSAPATLANPPAVGAGYLFTVGAEGAGSPLYILDAATGTLLASVPAPEGESFCGTPTTIENRVFVFTCSGILHAYDLEGGDA